MSQRDNRSGRRCSDVTPSVRKISLRYQSRGGGKNDLPRTPVLNGELEHTMSVRGDKSCLVCCGICRARRLVFNHSSANMRIEHGEVHLDVICVERTPGRGAISIGDMLSKSKRISLGNVSKKHLLQHVYKTYNVIFLCIHLSRLSLALSKMSSGHDLDDPGLLENPFGKISNESRITSLDSAKDQCMGGKRLS